jgi:molybdopterin synthase catalytic subunit
MIGLVAQSYVHDKGRFSLIDLLENVKGMPDFYRVGALAIFVGVVRGETLTGQTVKKLELEAYEEKANEVLGKICAELRKRKGIIDIQIHHLVGEFEVGDDMVYVLVAGSHRSNVFSVLRRAVERYKSEAPIFKKEYILGERGSESYWVSEHVDHLTHAKK